MRDTTPPSPTGDEPAQGLGRQRTSVAGGPRGRQARAVYGVGTPIGDVVAGVMALEHGSPEHGSLEHGALDGGPR